MNNSTTAKENKQIKKLMNRNILLTYINSGLMWGRFFIPVLALFYIASKVPLQQFTIIMGVFSLVIVIFEIPSGVIADLLGRKNALLISRLLFLAEIFLIAFYNGFWIFLIAKIISGIGVSLTSGTTGSILYDSLKNIKKEKEYRKHSSRVFLISNVSMAVIFIIGAYLFSINAKLPAILSLPLIGLGFILTFFYTEPFVNKKKITIKNSMKHFKESMKYFTKNKYLWFLGFFSLAIVATINIAMSMSSIYFVKILIPIYLIGIVACIANLIPAYSAKKTESYEKIWGEKKLLMIVYFLVMIGILLMALMIPYIGILFYFIIMFIYGFFTVSVDYYVNKVAISSHRTTLLSINNSFSNIGIALLFPIVGYVSTKYSLSTAYWMIGICLLFYAVFLIHYAISIKLYTKKNS